MTITHSEEKKVFSKNGEYAVGYYSIDSIISLYKIEGGNSVQLTELDRHSCTIVGVVFIDDNFFVSLDSGSVVKIWNIYKDTLRVCQTIRSEELNDKDVDGIFLHDYDKRQVKLETKQGYDVYSILADKYKHKTKNRLFVFESIIKETRSKQPLKKHINEKKKLQEPISEVVAKKEKPIFNPAKKLLDEATISHENIDKFYHNKKWTIGKKAQKIKSEQKIKKHVEIPLSTLTQSRDNSSVAHDTFNDSGISFDSPKHYIGFDLGTSRSKICYLKEGEPQRNVEIMTFAQKGADNNNISYESWVLPTIAAVIGNRIEYGYDALDYPKENCYHDLKRSLLDSSLINRDELTMLAAGYVAYVYKKCRESILENMNQPGMREEDLECQMSICVPVTQIDEDKSIEYLTRFRQLAEHACRNNAFYDYDKMCVEKNRIFNGKLLDDSPEFIDLVPEVVAEIRGYHKQKIAESINRDKRSSFDSYALISRKTGNNIYAIYDLGAGTTDLSIMSLNIDSDVSTRDGIGRGGKIYQSDIIYSGFSDIKNHHNETEIVLFYNEVLEKLRDVWVRFFKQDFKVKAGSLEYINNAVICLTGGGAECATVRKVFRKIPFYAAVGEYEITDKIFVLEGPSFWDAENKFPPYHRFGVSFGLTDDPRDLNYLYELPSIAEAFDNTQKQKVLSEEEIKEHRKHFVG